MPSLVGSEMCIRDRLNRVPFRGTLYPCLCCSNIAVLSSYVKKGNVEIILTPKEFDILYRLASNKGRIYSTKMLYEILWKDTFIETDNTVTMHIKNLRGKLGDSVKSGKYIKTIWGLGYKIEKDI